MESTSLTQERAPRSTPRTTPAAIAASGLTKRFGRVRAVDGADLRVEPGEVVAFLGPNGAGKSTTIDVILGLTRPDSGEISVFGTTPRSAIARGYVSAVLQTGGLLKDLTVRETVQLTASLFTDSRPVDEVLRRAGILEIADRMVGKCSGGQQQRLRFAMALLSDPGLLILDEPTTGMDVEGRRSFWQAIRADADRGRTVLFATHYLEEADAYADRIILMSHGRIVADGSTADIKGLVAGRILRATLPDADPAALAGFPGVKDVEVQGERIVVGTADSDGLARYLLTETDARDVEISSQNLESVFLALTTEGDAR
ncbi:ATP-binding cassette domain-containing protein [Microbacterium sp. SYP-A9085]|uniref:ABC transporter ATP-binding protein n=1 Tax=Microbacterium sp. SYP-A9085 TaxID=2664454 RepID=UPI00129B64A9|nr:ABC transporter ATP-binding protein [Microbacterium sp. SYP-A9085]MRH28353.1 ATP-binding cassette domain-containing protein [Microbacterium sp. SYP-A9085]